MHQKTPVNIHWSLKQGYKDSNLEMTESESVALPFGDSPISSVTCWTLDYNTKLFRVLQALFLFFSKKLKQSFYFIKKLNSKSNFKKVFPSISCIIRVLTGPR